MPSSESGGAVQSPRLAKRVLADALSTSKPRRRPSEESIRTELCDGPLYDVPEKPSCAESEDGVAMPEAPTEVSDRNEHIERLKRGETSIWKPKLKQRARKSNDSQQSTDIPRGNESKQYIMTGGTTWQHTEAVHETEHLNFGLSIERPRSALHSGDFTNFEAKEAEKKPLPQTKPAGLSGNSYLASSSFISTPPEMDSTTFKNFGGFAIPVKIPQSNQSPVRERSLTSSYSSSFAYKPPTSPLAYTQTNVEAQYSSEEDSSTGNRRRHTFQHISNPATPTGYYSGFHTPARRPSYQFQAHQPKRSVGTSRSFSLNEQNSLQATFQRARRPSVSDPTIKATLVGSYEESILHGRMSTTPSKPLDFVAQIGVLGLGNCKKNMKCPPHVSLPFPAVFYSYQSTGHGRPLKAEDEPSPYVGQIDLEHGLPHIEPTVTEAAHDKQRKRQTSSTSTALQTGTRTGHSPEQEERLARRRRRKEGSLKSPPGGSYRIPEKGQVQIIIKNPNKTAVKLFLIPYDLAGMEPSTKTFIRQRSYSAGPTVDAAETGSRADQTLAGQRDSRTLRYLAHLHICCPAKGRFYLYRNIKVVFATNRTPDGKEKLQNEIQYPEPRFSPYKPEKESAHSSGTVSPAAQTPTWLKRRSDIFPMDLDVMDGVLETAASPAWPAEQQSTRAASGVSAGFGGLDGTYDDLPTSQFGRMEVLPKFTDISAFGRTSRPQTSSDSNSNSSWGTAMAAQSTYGKLSNGDIGRRSATPVSANESLLARKLKDFSWNGRLEHNDDAV